MTQFASPTAARHTGLDMLRDSLRSPGMVAEVLDLSLREVKRWATLAHVYFGATKFTRKQDDARLAAEGYSISRLVHIDRFARRAATPARQWEFRLELLRFSGSVDEMITYAKTRQENYVEPHSPERGVSITQHDENIWSLHIRDEASRIAQLRKTLDAAAPKDESIPRARRRADAFWELVNSQSTLVEPAYRTVIAIGLEEFFQIIAGKGDEVKLGCSDGTIMTGADWLAHHLAGHLGEDIFAGLFHPVAGPVNLYRTRSASFKQRLMAISEQLVCAWEDCKEPGDNCEVHHIVAHNRGGETTPTNLTMLCRYHNGLIGSIDPNNLPKHPGAPNYPHRGWISRENGHVVYHPPGRKPPRTNPHSVSQLGAMHLI